jgi:hypothetical protein
MQGHVFVVLALLVATAAASSSASAAASWLESHKSPTDDQLSELKGANPQAFAIVNALLSKHHHVKKEGEPSGADIFRSMMTPPHLAKQHAYSPYASTDLAEVGTPVVAQAQFNPNAQSKRDDSAVSRLLSAVASMGGKKGKKIQSLLRKHEHKQEVDNPLAADSSLFEEAPKPVPVQDIVVPDVQAELAAPTAAPEEKHENSYLKGIDLSGDMPVSLRQPKKQNSYLKGIDLGSADSLATFSFGDAAPAAPPPVPAKVVAPKPKKDNAFLKWLGVVHKAPAPEEKLAEAPQPTKKTNSYLDKIKFFG